MQLINRYFSKALIVLLGIIIVSCGTPPSRDQAATESGAIQIALEDITQVLDEADKQSNEQRTFIYLNVTQALLDAEEIDWARNTLAYLSASYVPDDQYIRYSVVAAAIAVAQGQLLRAREHLWHTRVNSIAERAPVEDVIKLYQTRAQVLAGLAEYRESVEQRIALHKLLDENTDASNQNQDALWRALMELPLEDLKLESQIQNTMFARGWYTLAALSKNNQTNLLQQIKEVDNWILRWPEHPASLRLPADLQLLKQLEQERPSQVAILLPFTGRFEGASNAIRDGIMAAYYNAGKQASTLPDLRIYDSSDRDIIELYDEAVLNGAELIIGPLEQEKIVDLALKPELPIPTLALNRIPEEIPTPAGLFQFGLPLEDEAEQVAVQAWKDGYRRAMVIAPETTSGDRSVQSFSNRWIALGGELTKDHRYKDQSSYLNMIRAAVKIDESEERKNRIRDIIGKNVEFEPRRRQDVDFIFLYSQASQARQIKPLLAFNYAGDIPVYALKDIYNGQVDTKSDKDLNEIRFTTLPWFFERNLPEKEAINKVSSSSNYQFLYALGVDAYHVHPRLRQLQQVAQANFYGATGKLHLDPQRRLIREQIWAKFVNGRAVPVKAFTEEDEF